MSSSALVARLLFQDPHVILTGLDRLCAEAGGMDKAAVVSRILSMAEEINGLSAFRQIADRPFFELEGEICGAVPGDDPFGGGPGYRDGFTSGDYIVSGPDELIDAVGQAVSGQVIFIPGDVVIDLTDDQYTDGFVLRLAAGVVLAGDRGVMGSPGAVILTRRWDTNPLLEVTGDDTRITGLCIRGPDPADHDRMHTQCYRGSGPSRSFDHSRYYKVPMSFGVTVTGNRAEIDNCEIAGFSKAAVNLVRGAGHRVHHNYIHHNILKGLGYGVCHRLARSVIEYNVFDCNRHSIAASGAPGSGYEARHNIELGHANGHNFDAHGGADRKDGTDIACAYVLMHHNTFLEEKHYPYWLRGTPEDRQEFSNNYVWQPLEAFDLGHLVGKNAVMRNNAFGHATPVLVR